MINKNHAVKLFAIIAVTVFFGLIIFSGCTDEKEVVRTETVTVHDTVTVTITMRDTVTIIIDNVSVDTVLVNPDSITVGKSVMLTANVSTQPGVGPLSYTWSANAGTFDSQTGDTVTWTAPDDPGVYMIKVIAEDGTYSGVATLLIGVGMYTPTATPYYLGDAACAGCHSNAHADWEPTAHAHAWESLQTSDHAGPSCFPCHSVGYEPSPNTGNSGFDEAPIEKFENAQCENCHGPGSEHVATTGGTELLVTLDVQDCGKCHDGTHHPYLTQWQQSGHNFDPAVGAHGAGQRSTCQPCHSGAGFVEAFPTNTYTTHAITWSDSTTFGITCQTCHDPHSVANPHQLRTLADLTLVSGEVISGIGAGQLCIQCHHARHEPLEQIIEGDAHFGPHAGTQGDVVFGTSAYEDMNPNFTFASSGHGLVNDACVACHVYRTEFDPITNFANVGHTFEPRVEACQNCHGSYVTSFDDIIAKNDFDGDGATESIRQEVTGLMDLLVTTLFQADSNNVYFGNDPNIDVTTMIDSLSATAGDTSAFAVKLRKGGYDLAYVNDDGSEGVHNPAYVVQLLQQSILFLDPNALPSGSILNKDRATTLTTMVYPSE